MAKKMLIDATHPEETRVVVVDGSRIEEFDYETITKVQISGNIYLAKVTRVEPSLQAAFVEYGGNRHGFLAFSEIHPDYYQIPVADREALLAAERAAARDEDFDDDDPQAGRKSDRRGNGRRGGRSEESSEDNGRDRRRRGRRREGGRRRGGLTVTPLSEETILPEPLQTAEIAGERLETPSRAALIAMAEAAGGMEQTAAPAEAAAPEDQTPDLSDVTEIEIHRLASPEETAEGAPDVVVERIAVGEPSELVMQEPASEEPAEIQSEASPKSLAESVGAGGRVAVAAAAQDDAAPAAQDDAAPAAQDDAAPAAEDDAAPAQIEEDAALETQTDDLDHSAEQQEEPAAAPAAAPAEDDEDAAEHIEEIGAEDARDEIRARRPRLKDYRIQEVIKRRQILLVQVVKEERGTKGAALTTYLSLAGRYCVLMPNTARGGGISRKITNAADRKRLKAVAQELEVPEGMGLIIRTAGANRTKAEIKRDFEYLLRQWSAIRDLTLKSIAPTLIYEEGSLIKRAIRDLYNKDIEAILVEGDDGYREAKDYMKMLMPSHAKHVQPYREMAPLFSRHQVETQIGAMMNPTVPLKSGGYLVIGITEALVAIDVNSGRSTKEGSIEDTALKTNLEAAEEAARQMRLRDLAGLVVIDFIDMEESKNNRAVEKRLKEKLKDDRARIQIGRISGFGLLEMSRQRLRPGLLEATTVPCPHCRGAGVVRAPESLALTILRAVEEEGARGRSPAVRVAAPVGIANFLMNQKRARIAMIEERHDIQVIIEGDPAMISPDFVTERVKPIAREEPVSRAIQVEAGYSGLEDEDEFEDGSEAESAVEAENAVEAEDAIEVESAEGEDRAEGRGRRRRRRGRNGRDGEERALEADADTAETAVEDAADDRGDGDGEDLTQVSASSDDEPRKRRGRRGGRRRRRRDEEDGDAAGGDPLPVIDFEGGDAADSSEVGVEAAADDGLNTPERRVANADPQTADTEETPQDPDGDPNLDSADLVAPDPDTSPIERPTASMEEIAPLRPEDAAPKPAAANGAGASTAAEAPAAPSAPDPSQPRRTGWWSFRRN